jgi:hypothetical protein
MRDDIIRKFEDDQRNLPARKDDGGRYEKPIAGIKERRTKTPAPPSRERFGVLDDPSGRLLLEIAATENSDDVMGPAPTKH